MTSPDRCFACNARLSRPEFVFLTDHMSDGKHYEVNVGPECFHHVETAGAEGYQPPKGGPRLFLTADFASDAARTTPEGPAS